MRIGAVTRSAGRRTYSLPLSLLMKRKFEQSTSLSRAIDCGVRTWKFTADKRLITGSARSSSLSSISTGRVPLADSPNRPYKMADQPKPKLELDEGEQQLTDLLREAISTPGVFGDPDVEVRYAGGWVRDKILGKPSHDIDIAVSTISGHEFAVAFMGWVGRTHPEVGEASSTTVAKILANPEKSKHLDTATARFGGKIECDFVQLRTETYADSGDTRTPSATGVGTLEQDAERRDCTMNALYYNVQTGEVEDPTGRGLEDLRGGMIRTPLAPRQTFLDDPLRVLRCLRFASQFRFEIDEDTFATMATPEVQAALDRKVVRERIGIEVGKMLNGIDPARAILALHSRGLYPIVFHPVANADGEEREDAWFDRVTEAMGSLEGEVAEALAGYMKDGRLWLAIALLPYAHDLLPPNKRGARDPLPSFIVRDRLKLPNSADLLVRALFPPPTRATDATTPPTGAELSVKKALPELTFNGSCEIVVPGNAAFEDLSEVERERLVLGRMVKTLGVGTWELALWVSCQTGVYAGCDSKTKPFVFLAKKLNDTYPDIVPTLAGKPLLDGKALKKQVYDALGCTKVTLMRALVDKAALYQAAFAETTDAEERLVRLLKGWLKAEMLE
ncbi:CCA tRNA nucleotidyltransferase, mitochondrial [Savitreella phatthalungensis]